MARQLVHIRGNWRNPRKRTGAKHMQSGHKTLCGMNVTEHVEAVDGYTMATDKFYTYKITCPTCFAKQSEGR